VVWTSAPRLTGDQRVEATTERNRLLAALPDADYQALATHFQVVDLRAQQVLAWPDEPIRHVYFERDGLVSVLVPMEDGKSVDGAIIGNEGMIGLQAFLGDGIAREELVQVTAGQAVRVPIAAFREFVAHCTALHTLLSRYTLALMTDMARAAGCNRLHSVEQRLARLLMVMVDRAGRETFALTHDVLASLLGARRASVTRAACALAAARLIDYRRGHLTITDRLGLTQVACEDYRHSRDAFVRMFDELRLRATHSRNIGRAPMYLVPRLLSA
jgi:CRP-like cAMP-binding protein